jgi:hypothetical protein
MDNPRKESLFVEWDATNQICFTGGKGFGLTPELKSVCLGDEKSVNQYLNGNSPLPKNISLNAVECLKSVKKMKGDKENDIKPIRSSGFIKQRNFGNRFTQSIKHRACDITRATPGQKVPCRKVERPQ